MVDDDSIKRWFCQEVLAREPEIHRFIQRNVRDMEETADLLHEVYAAMIQSAQQGLPDDTGAYLFRVARNAVINRAKRAQIVSFVQVSDLDALVSEQAFDATDRHLSSREGLRRAQLGLAALPARCREVVRLRKIEGMTTREVAAHLGVTVHTIERQLTLGMRALTDFMLGGEGRIDRNTKAAKQGKRKRV